MPDLDTLFAALSREPDVDAPELLAHDATDRLLLETAGSEAGPAASGTIVVIGDRHGALTLGAASRLGARDIRVHQDPILGERALAANAERIGSSGIYRNHDLGEKLLAGAELVLVQLPRSLAELDEIAQTIARWAAPGVTVLAGGRVKHMTHGMNEVLERSFARVSAGLAVRKSRILTARSPRSATELGEPRFPIWGDDPDLPFRIAAHGATFGGAALDHGSRLLLRTIGAPPSPAPRIVDRSADARAGDHSGIVDLGCGNGVLATAAALAAPQARVTATDQSRAAVAAARLTADAAGVGERVSVHRADATEAVPDGWADLILLNPPFHTGSTVHPGVAHRLIRASAGALQTGGELRLVFNSHLRYRTLVEREIGPSRELARDRRFTVLSAIRR
ncbi:class I SAM-dependent methyltransferase [Leucobacter weissii]|uniref:class I SAM-dependent methyltransferase n=1 Tax=Leucobacter weissii TaxID=1983706 RepID=UPI003133223D